MNDKPTYSIVIPVFNSSTSLTTLFEGLLSFFNNTAFEVIFIDDGSSNPNTWATIDSLANKHPQIIGFRFRKNFGKPSALLCGFKAATGNYIITMDDDLQHDPNELSKLINEQQHDVVIGVFEKKKHPLFKRILSIVKNRVEVWAYQKPRSVIISPFKLIKKEIIDDILKIKSNKPFIASLLFAVTHDIINVPVLHQARKYEKSGFTYSKMWQTFNNLLFNNSSFLVKIITGIGLLLFSTAIVVFTYYLTTYNNFSHSYNTFTLTIPVVLTVGGLVLISIGIVGEYLIRIISGVEQRPAYFVSTKTTK